MMGKLAEFFRRAEPAVLDARPGDAAALAALHRISFRHGWSESEFERLLSDRAAIAHVARAHGGEARFVDAERGATLEVSLPPWRAAEG